MPPLPVVSGQECIRALRHAGYAITRVRGSHYRLMAPGRSPVTVPLHRELDRGTLRAILQTAGVQVAEFLEFLQRG